MNDTRLADPGDRLGGWSRRFAGWDRVAAMIAIAVAQLVRPAPDGLGAEFWVLWPILALACAAGMWVVTAWPARPSRPSLGHLLIGQVVALWLLFDLPLVRSVGLYDFRVYLAGGEHALHGQAVYLTAPLLHQPASAAQDFFLYPPPLIPVLEAMARIPYEIVAAAWVVILVVAAIAALRALGLGWTWAIVLLAFPGLVKGINSGNVANVAFLLFVLGWRLGWPLVLGTLLKVQTAIPALWLVRERRWRPLLIGLAIVAVLVVVTLPVVGLASWRDWLLGLVYRDQSQVNLPILYGDSLAAFLPRLLYLGLAAGATVVALVPSGRRGLAALGVATIVASPSLWPHGFVWAIPALLGARRSSLVWLALGLGGSFDLVGLWAMTLVAALALVTRDWDRTEIEPDATHPFGGTLGPWAGIRPPTPAAR